MLPLPFPARWPSRGRLCAVLGKTLNRAAGSGGEGARGPRAEWRWTRVDGEPRDAQSRACGPERERQEGRENSARCGRVCTHPAVGLLPRLTPPTPTPAQASCCVRVGTQPHLPFPSARHRRTPAAPPVTVCPCKYYWELCCTGAHGTSINPCSLQLPTINNIPS